MNRSDFLKAFAAIPLLGPLLTTAPIARPQTRQADIMRQQQELANAQYAMYKETYIPEIWSQQIHAKFYEEGFRKHL